jgi:hypothetical protein
MPPRVQGRLVQGPFLCRPRRPIRTPLILYTGAAAQMCYEERVLYRMLSGMHASINIHVALAYKPPKRGVRADWQSNPQRFAEQYAPHPERLKNMYFSYVVLLRALRKVPPSCTHTCAAARFRRAPVSPLQPPPKNPSAPAASYSCQLTVSVSDSSPPPSVGAPCLGRKGSRLHLALPPLTSRCVCVCVCNAAGVTVPVQLPVPPGRAGGGRADGGAGAAAAGQVSLLG